MSGRCFEKADGKPRCSVPDRSANDAPVVWQIRRAGGLMLGQTVTTELAHQVEQDRKLGRGTVMAVRQTRARLQPDQTGRPQCATGTEAGTARDAARVAITRAASSDWRCSQSLSVVQRENGSRDAGRTPLGKSSKFCHFQT
jgi:hypothetical protein